MDAHARPRFPSFALSADTTWAERYPRRVVRANLSWLDEFYNAIFPTVRPRHSYQNFPDPQSADWRTAYYGQNYNRLVTVKRHYDPTGFFTHPQAVGR